MPAVTPSWSRSTDYGDGRVYRNVTVADLRDGHAIRVTDYWGEPFEAPAWRESLADALDMPPRGSAGSRSPSRRRRIALSVPSARVVNRDARPFRKSRIATLRAPCSRPSLAGECESDGFGAPRCRSSSPASRPCPCTTLTWCSRAGFSWSSQASTRSATTLATARAGAGAHGSAFVE